jgi:hypothetical protein
MVATDAEETISKEQIRQFQEEGYLFLPEAIDVDKIDRLRDEANRILELLVNSSLANDRLSERLTFNNNDNGTQSVRTAIPINDLSLVFKRIATDAFPGLLQPLTDDDPVLMEPFSQINYKQPLPEPIEEFDNSDTSEGYEPHADWPYFEGDVPLQEEFLIGSIVFIDACTEDNGPLEVWPGTHKQEFKHVSKSHGGVAIQSDQFDQTGGRTILGPAGSVLFFDSRLVHSSEPNVTDKPRRLGVYRHTPASNVETDIGDGSVQVDSRSEYPFELIESAYENEYRRLKQQGEFEDRFRAPRT